jgi:GAF domain-containing protein
LQALNKRSGPFTANDEQHLQLVGVHLGNTLAKSRFYEEAKREKARLATLSKCFRRLSAVVS